MKIGVLPITLLAGSILLGGCAGSGDWSFSSSKPQNPAATLGLKSFDENVVPMRDYVYQEARQHQIPEQFLSEARISLTQIEQVLAATRAGEIEQEASLREGLARVSAHREAARAREESRMAQAEKVQNLFSAKQNELWVSIAARERSLGSTIEQNAAMIEAFRKEREMAHSEMTSRAWQEFTRAQSQIEQMQAVRKATLNEGEAALAEMRENLQATKSRADATVSKLRSEAESSRKQAAAMVDQIAVQISSIRTQSKVEADKLRTRAASLEKESLARYNEMVARADALTEQGSKEQYELKINAARTAMRQAKSEYENLRSRAETTLERAQAEIERLQADAEQIAYLADSNFVNGTAELEAWFTSELAEISKLRSRADRMEAQARAAFVKAEAEARANATRETAAHQSELAEAQMNAIIAEAEHEAVRVRSLLLDELARQQKQNSVEFPGKTDAPEPPPSDLHKVPTVPIVTPITARVEPERVAVYRSSLARVMNTRVNADAQEMALNATFEESQSRLGSVLAHFKALSTEKLAIAEAMTTQARAQFDDLTTQADALLAMAEADYERATTEADAFRKEMLAEASDLRADARNSRELAAARAELLLIEADVIAKHGESEAQALEAALDATKRRGTAEYNRLRVEADAVEQSNIALTQQIAAQIAAAQRILDAELAKQDRTIESSITIAEANYSQTMVEADVFARKTSVEIDRLLAQNQHEQTLVAAEIDHLRNLSYSTVLKADATVGRILASARAEREQAEAVAEVASAKLRTETDMTRAELLAQSRAATAAENAVKANFDARLVQVESQRVRDMTELYRDDFFKRANLEASLATAEAVRSDMNARFAQLKQEQEQLQRAARENWDARLASMHQRPRNWSQPRPALPLPSDLENIQITNVPTSRD